MTLSTESLIVVPVEDEAPPTETPLYVFSKQPRLEIWRGVLHADGTWDLISLNSTFREAGNAERSSVFCWLKSAAIPAEQSAARWFDQNKLLPYAGTDVLLFSPQYGVFIGERRSAILEPRFGRWESATLKMMNFSEDTQQRFLATVTHWCSIPEIEEGV